MKERFSVSRMSVILTVVLVIIWSLAEIVQASEPFPIGKSFVLDLPDKYQRNYDADADIYYFTVKSDEESLIITDVVDFTDYGYTGTSITEELENQMIPMDKIKFTGSPQQADGFHWLPCERLINNEWYESIFVYYGTHLMRVSCIAGSADNLYDILNYIHITDDSHSAVQSSDQISSDIKLIQLGDGFNLLNKGEYDVVFDKEGNSYTIIDSESNLFIVVPIKINEMFEGFTQESLVSELRDQWEVLNEKVLENARILSTPKELSYGISYVPMITIIGDSNIDSAYLIYGNDLLNVYSFNEGQKIILQLAADILPVSVSYPNQIENSYNAEEMSELYEKGKAAYDKKDYASALPYLERAAEMGSTESMVLLGYMYSFGYGVDKSPDTGRDFYLKAADMGNVEAQYLVGEMYSAGFGVEKSDEIANQYYLEAADQGYGDAQFKIGHRYYYGNNGLKQDYDLAFKYIRMAADQQIAETQYLLGLMYEFGRGTNESFEKAVEWYRAAAEQGHANAQCNLGFMYYHGRGIDQSYEKAAEWYKKAADQGQSRAQNLLANMYLLGYGVPKSYEDAVNYYQKAADQNNSDAAQMLGLLYYNGEGVPQSYEKAAEYFQMAAEQDVPDADYMLGILYYNGRGVDQSYEKAFSYYQKAAELGHVVSQFNLGVMYYNGLGVTQSYENAVDYYLQASAGGDMSANNNLGWMYQHGLGVDQSYEKAAKYYQLAADQNHATSLNNLGWLYQYGLGVAQSDEKALYYYRLALENLKPGSVLVIGSCEQDNNTSNGEEEVEWLIIAIEDDKALLVSKYGLDIKSYNTQPADASWKESSIRSWLNGSFYEDTFSSFDKSRIMQSVILSGSVETTDRIFLLSIEELGKNGTINYSTKPTAYAAAHGAVIDESGNSVWWLRTDGLDSSYAACVDPDGKLDEKGRRKTDNGVLAVPAFWLDMKALDGIDSISQIEADSESSKSLDAKTVSEYAEIGIDAYRNENYEKALEYLVPAAESGDKSAQLCLGIMYDFGKGVEQSDEKASEWYQKAAAQGEMIAQLNLGVNYENGYGVPQSYEKAVELYQMAADQGLASAQFLLGTLYYDGNGVPQSYEKAAELFQLAAEQGHAASQYNLANMYETGRGVEKSPELAAKWYLASAEQGDMDAQREIGYIYITGTGVDQSYEKALEWLLKAAVQGDATSQYNLGVMHEYGEGVEQSKEIAISYYTLAAAQGDENAVNKLKELGVLSK